MAELRFWARWCRCAFAAAALALNLRCSRRPRSRLGVSCCTDDSSSSSGSSLLLLSFRCPFRDRLFKLSSIGACSSNIFETMNWSFFSSTRCVFERLRWTRGELSNAYVTFIQIDYAQTWIRHLRNRVWLKRDSFRARQIRKKKTVTRRVYIFREKRVYDCSLLEHLFRCKRTIVQQAIKLHTRFIAYHKQIERYKRLRDSMLPLSRITRHWETKPRTVGGFICQL